MMENPFPIEYSLFIEFLIELNSVVFILLPPPPLLHIKSQVYYQLNYIFFWYFLFKKLGFVIYSFSLFVCL